MAAGIFIANASLNTVGGVTPAARNIISSNGAEGVLIGLLIAPKEPPPDADGNKIQGNYIGTDVTGTVDLGNGETGVTVVGSENEIGGVVPGAGNLISGNDRDGVLVVLSTGNSVQGNLIGTDVTGTVALRNTFNGVVVQGASGNTIGGTVAGARNVISGNGRAGVMIENVFEFETTSNNLVQGNFIGTDVTGTKPLGNSHHGIEVDAE